MKSAQQSSETLNEISKLYNNRGYFSLYGMDIVISIIIILIIGYSAIYFFIISFRPYISKNWPINRCNPLYMPFAGLLNKDNNKSFFGAAEENFNFCIGNILHAISEEQFSPLYYANKIINNLLSIISKTINSIREMINKIRVFFSNIARNISNRTLNIMMPLLAFNLKNFDTFNRVHGLLMAAVYQVFGLFTTSYSLLGFFRDGLIGLLIV